MSYIFKAKTSEAYHIKILVELLSNNIKIAHFEIDKEGVKLIMMDAHRKILVDLILRAENFSFYNLNVEKKYLGINLNHLHKMVKSIKKKDKLELFIKKDNPTKLGICVIPKENNRLTTSYITIQSVQELAIDVPVNTGKSIIISSSEFQKMVKDLANIGNTINIKSNNFHIKFSCETGGILERAVEFGDVEVDDEESKVVFDQDYPAEQLSRLTKIGGLDSHIKIFQGMPILFKSNIGILGELSLYIKSKQQINDDNTITNVDEEEEYESD